MFLQYTYINNKTNSDDLIKNMFKPTSNNTIKVTDDTLYFPTVEIKNNDEKSSLRPIPFDNG